MGCHSSRILFSIDESQLCLGNSGCMATHYWKRFQCWTNLKGTQEKETAPLSYSFLCLPAQRGQLNRQWDWPWALGLCERGGQLFSVYFLHTMHNPINLCNVSFLPIFPLNYKPLNVLTSPHRAFAQATWLFELFLFYFFSNPTISFLSRYTFKCSAQTCASLCCKIQHVGIHSAVCLHNQPYHIRDTMPAGKNSF